MLPANKILVIKLRAIGDVILSLPVITNLRAAYPEARIDFLTENPAAPIAKMHPGVDEVIIFDRSAARSRPFPQSLQENLRFFRSLQAKKYDLVFDLFGNPRSALFARVTGARHRVGFNFRGRRYAYNIVVTGRGDRVHEVEFNLDALRHIGVPIQTTDLQIAPAPEHADFAGQFWQQNGLAGQRVVGINVSGGWYTKRWPLEKYAGLADRIIAELDATVLLIWGPGERDDVRQVETRMQRQPVIAPATNLPQLAALLRRLELLVTNDSGPMHLAAAVGTRIAGIYGPTRPELQGPWGQGHAIIRKDGLDCLGCNGVTCRIQTHDCMRLLGMDAVCEVVVKMLAASKNKPEIPNPKSQIPNPK